MSDDEPTGESSSPDATERHSADSTPEATDSVEDPGIDPIPDTRLYIPNEDDWEVHIKRDSERLYCYSKHPGQDWFHLLLHGEIYVSRQHEKYCLRCALRMGFVTEDRLFWQHRVPRRRNNAL